LGRSGAVGAVARESRQIAILTFAKLTLCRDQESSTSRTSLAG
jgi:hypothetical protein